MSLLHNANFRRVIILLAFCLTAGTSEAQGSAKIRQANAYWENGNIIIYGLRRTDGRNEVFATRYGASLSPTADFVSEYDGRLDVCRIEKRFGMYYLLCSPDLSYSDIAFWVLGEDLKLKHSGTYSGEDSDLESKMTRQAELLRSNLDAYTLEVPLTTWYDAGPKVIDDHLMLVNSTGVRCYRPVMERTAVLSYAPAWTVSQAFVNPVNYEFVTVRGSRLVVYVNDGYAHQWLMLIDMQTGKLLYSNEINEAGEVVVVSSAYINDQDEVVIAGNVDRLGTNAPSGINNIDELVFMRFSGTGRLLTKQRIAMFDFRHLSKKLAACDKPVLAFQVLDKQGDEYSVLAQVYNMLPLPPGMLTEELPPNSYYYQFIGFAQIVLRSDLTIKDTVFWTTKPHLQIGGISREQLISGGRPQHDSGNGFAISPYGVNAVHHDAAGRSTVMSLYLIDRSGRKSRHYALRFSKFGAEHHLLSVEKMGSAAIISLPATAYFADDSFTFTKFTFNERKSTFLLVKTPLP